MKLWVRIASIACFVISIASLTGSFIIIHRVNRPSQVTEIKAPPISSDQSGTSIQTSSTTDEDALEAHAAAFDAESSIAQKKHEEGQAMCEEIVAQYGREAADISCQPVGGNWYRLAKGDSSARYVLLAMEGRGFDPERSKLVFSCENGRASDLSLRTALSNGYFNETQAFLMTSTLSTSAGESAIRNVWTEQRVLRPDGPGAVIYPNGNYTHLFYSIGQSDLYKLDLYLPSGAELSLTFSAVGLDSKQFDSDCGSEPVAKVE